MATTTTVTITDDDVQRADAFLTAYLSEKVPDADFSKGSALRDLVVKAIAYIYAYLEAERRIARNSSSLLLLSKMPPSADVDAAVDAFLSNLLITRNTGKPTRLPVTLHFSAQADFVLSPSTRFFRTASLVFLPDLSSTTTIAASALRQATSANGAVDWTYTINLVSAANSADYNVQPGRFLKADTFSPYFTYAENVNEGVDGKGPETTTALLARAPTAISTRNLINVRSIDAVLFDLFPEIERTLTVGMGEPEMLRDLAPGLNVHTGGHSDIYVGLPRATTTFEGVAGGLYPRADGRVVVIRDPTVGASAFTGVLPGHVLNITAGVPGAPRQALVVRATPAELEVADPLPLATDRSTATISYSIGALSPNFDDVVPARTTGETSSSMSKPGVVYLPAGPVYRVKKVETLSGGNWLEAATRVNGEPASASEYQVEVLNPRSAQSTQMVTRVVLHPTLNGSTVRVTYDTLAGLAAVQAHVSGPTTRVVSSNQLVRGYNPVYISAEIAYDLRVGATTRYEPAQLAQFAATTINEFNWADVIDTSDLIDALKDKFPDIGTVFPFKLKYSLVSPDGQVLTFTSGDVVTVSPSENTSAKLTNGAAVTPILATSNELADYLATRGVTDRTVRYFADMSDLYIWERAVDATPAGYVAPGVQTAGAPSLSMRYTGAPLRFSTGAYNSLTLHRLEFLRDGVLDATAGTNVIASAMFILNGLPGSLSTPTFSPTAGIATPNLGSITPPTYQVGEGQIIVAAPGYMPLYIPVDFT